MSKQVCPGAEHLKVKKPVYVGEMRVNLHSTATDQLLYIYPCLFFHLTVNEISRNKATSFPGLFPFELGRREGKSPGNEVGNKAKKLPETFDRETAVDAGVRVDRAE